MNKFLSFIIISIFWSSYSFAGSGSGTINLSDSVIKNFQAYVNSTKPKPVVFLVTEDGKDSKGWMCPYAQCMQTGSMQEEDRCEDQFKKKCYRLAMRRVVVWKNEFTKNASRSQKKFSSKDDFETIKSKLASLGLVGNFTNETKNTQNDEIKKDENKNSKLTSEVIDQLNSLNDLFKSGVITKEEFDKAKKRILN